VPDSGGSPWRLRAGAPCPDPLWAGDANQDTTFDGQGPPNQDLALERAIVEALLVVAALTVAIEELADGRVSPVDDVDPVAGVDEGGAPDQHVALDQAAPADLFAQAQVAEIGRRGIDQ